MSWLCVVLERRSVPRFSREVAGELFFAGSIRCGTGAPGFGKALFGGAAHGPAPHGADEGLNLLDLAAAPGLAGGRNGGKALQPLSCFRKLGRSVDGAI